MVAELKSFLKLYEGKSTQKTYKSALTHFFNSIYPDTKPSKKGKRSKKEVEIAQKKLEDKSEKYFSTKRDIKKDITDFQTSMNGKPPKTIGLYITAVRSFLIENEIEFPERFWRRVRGRIKGRNAITKDEVPDNKKLRQIFTHMTTKGKALFLTLASSGMRIGESLKLETDDIDFQRTPTKIDILSKYTKGGNRRIAFVSSEATEALQEWLKIREDFLKTSRGGKSKINSKQVFPFLDTTARFIWNEALRKSGFTKFDKETNRRTIHPHVLRKFFRSRMTLVMPLDMVEALMGHEGYLTGAYRKYTEEQLAEKYLEAEHTIAVFREMSEVTQLKKEIKKRNEVLENMFIEIKGENKRLQEDLKNQKTITDTIAEKNLKMDRDYEEIRKLLPKQEKPLEISEEEQQHNDEMYERFLEDQKYRKEHPEEFKIKRETEEQRKYGEEHEPQEYLDAKHTAHLENEVEHLREELEKDRKRLKEIEKILKINKK